MQTENSSGFLKKYYFKSVFTIQIRIRLFFFYWTWSGDWNQNRKTRFPKKSLRTGTFIGTNLSLFEKPETIKLNTIFSVLTVSLTSNHVTYFVHYIILSTFFRRSLYYLNKKKKKSSFTKRYTIWNHEFLRTGYPFLFFLESRLEPKKSVRFQFPI